MNKPKNYHTWKDQEKEWMSNPEFAVRAEEAEPEYQLARTLIAKRLQKGLTQAELAQKAHTSQSAIARIESGTYLASLSFLKRIAQALDAHVRISVQ